MAEDDICVAVSGVSKKFARSLKRSFVYGARDIASTLLGLPGGDALRPSEFWAVRDVSFELRRGDAIGIIGLNGSGKTTLLRMISGILRPTLGNIRINGRIAPMLALGAGFKPVLSGRENIFLNLSLLGVSERDIRRRFDAIVDFSELSESIDAPIGTYSSGMLARLGFACAVHTDPGILVVDEVLSVGDTRFRLKCRNKINELRREGTAMLLVSHSTLLIESLTTGCLYLRKGRAAAFGAPADVLKAYEKDQLVSAHSHNGDKLGMAPASGIAGDDAPLRIRAVEILAGRDGVQGSWISGRPGDLVIGLEAGQAVDHVTANVLIVDQTHQPGETVQIVRTRDDDGLLGVPAGQSEIRLSLPQVGLRPGIYRLKINVSRMRERRMLDVIDNLRLVVQDAGVTRNCLYYQPREWAYSGISVIEPASVTDDRDDE